MPCKEDIDYLNAELSDIDDLEYKLQQRGIIETIDPQEKELYLKILLFLAESNYNILEELMEIREYMKMMALTKDQYKEGYFCYKGQEMQKEFIEGGNKK
jgi:hypothetical protein